MIRTELGKNIEIQHNVVCPQPYSRKYQLTGTKGFANKHPIHRQLEEIARKVGGHEWCCLTELSGLSLEHGSIPVQIPDFTRGHWNDVQGLIFAE